MRGPFGNMRITGIISGVAFLLFAIPPVPSVIAWPALGVFLGAGWLFLIAMKRRHDELADLLPDDDADDEEIASAAAKILERGRRL